MNKTIDIIEIVFKSFKIITRGIGQIFLQCNSITGILFCVAMFYGNAEMAYTMIICTVVSTSTAVLLHLPSNHIQNGLYGFNAALIGCAMIFYFHVNTAVVLAYLIGSIASTLVMHLFLMCNTRAYTFPFIAITWLLKLILEANTHDGTPLARSRIPGPTIDYAGFDYPGNGLVIPSHAFGQVLFQGDFISGLIMVIAIFINCPVSSLYGIIGTHISVIIINLYYPFISNTVGHDLINDGDGSQRVILDTLNGGLYSFNAVLAGIASSGPSPFYLVKLIVTVTISTTFFLHLKLNNFTTLTFPFVLSLWTVNILNYVIQQNVNLLTLNYYKNNFNQFKKKFLKDQKDKGKVKGKGKNLNHHHHIDKNEKYKELMNTNNNNSNNNNIETRIELIELNPSTTNNLIGGSNNELIIPINLNNSTNTTNNNNNHNHIYE